MRFQAVLVDWRGTIVHDPPLDWWLCNACARIGRDVDEAELASMKQALSDAFERPEYADLDRRMDTSVEQHRSDMLTVFTWAGLDAELAEALYGQDFDPAWHRLHPGVIDALGAIRRRGLRTALVSNIHFDLRPELQSQGVLHLLDAVILSFEHGTQKPEAAIFELALDALGVRSSEAIMVGDSVVHDGGAEALGITTVILPRLEEFGPQDFGPAFTVIHKGLTGGGR